MVSQYDYKNILTFIVDMHFPSTVLRVVHLQVTTTFEAQDLWALYLQIPQLYPDDVTPVNQVLNEYVNIYSLFKSSMSESARVADLFY